ncbi:hypothetical protein BG004_008176 [Podila humilis]|nr:hypothetical protein BG004_008176 [Podila humilis]
MHNAVDPQVYYQQQQQAAEELTHAIPIDPVSNLPIFSTSTPKCTSKGPPLLYPVAPTLGQPSNLALDHYTIPKNVSLTAKRSQNQDGSSSRRSRIKSRNLSARKSLRRNFIKVREMVQFLLQLPREEQLKYEDEAQTKYKETLARIKRFDKRDRANRRKLAKARKKAKRQEADDRKAERKAKLFLRPGSVHRRSAADEHYNTWRKLSNDAKRRVANEAARQAELIRTEKTAAINYGLKRRLKKKTSVKYMKLHDRVYMSLFRKREKVRCQLKQIGVGSWGRTPKWVVVRRIIELEQERQRLEREHLNHNLTLDELVKGRHQQLILEDEELTEEQKEILSDLRNSGQYDAPKAKRKLRQKAALDIRLQARVEQFRQSILHYQAKVDKQEEKRKARVMRKDRRMRRLNEKAEQRSMQKLEEFFKQDGMEALIHQRRYRAAPSLLRAMEVVKVPDQGIKPQPETIPETASQKRPANMAGKAPEDATNPAPEVPKLKRHFVRPVKPNRPLVKMYTSGLVHKASRSYVYLARTKTGVNVFGAKLGMKSLRKVEILRRFLVRRRAALGLAGPITNEDLTKGVLRKALGGRLPHLSHLVPPFNSIQPSKETKKREWQPEEAEDDQGIVDAKRQRTGPASKVVPLFKQKGATDRSFQQEDAIISKKAADFVSFRKPWLVSDNPEVPNLPSPAAAQIAYSLVSREQQKALSLSVLEPEKDFESYRWPVQEAALPSIPDKFLDEDAKQVSGACEQKGISFLAELSGVAKTDRDYSDIGMEESNVSLRKYQERAQQQQYEKNTNERLMKTHRFFEEEMSAFAQAQYTKELSEHRASENSRMSRSSSPCPMTDTVASELSPVQENAAVFSAEDTLMSVLGRMPYVLRQGAMGRNPDYVTQGHARPMPTVAAYERGWDSVMLAASMAGVDNNILKKVSYRMNTLLRHSNNKYHHESPFQEVAFDEHQSYMTQKQNASFKYSSDAEHAGKTVPVVDFSGEDSEEDSEEEPEQEWFEWSEQDDG